MGHGQKVSENNNAHESTPLRICILYSERSSQNMSTYKAGASARLNFESVFVGIESASFSFVHSLQYSIEVKRSLRIVTNCNQDVDDDDAF